MTIRELTLTDLGHVSRGRSRHRPRDADFLYGGPYPFIQTGDVKKANFFVKEFSQTYSDAGLAQSKMWPAGTLCITIAANIAEVAILGIDACFPDSIIGFIADESICDHRYVKYWFDAYKRQFKQVAQGAAQDNLSQQKLLSFKLPVPDLSVQGRIADILYGYDHLIENNRRRIALLEEATHELFAEWFVRLRFPGHEHVIFLDGVPEGWERKLLPEIVEINPRTPIDKHKLSTYVPMAGLSETLSIITETEMRTGGSGTKFRNYDTLLARITPCIENGKTAFVQILPDGETGFGSTEFIVLRSRTVTPAWVYCLARTDHIRQTAINSMKGSDGRQRVNPDCFNYYSVLQPCSSVLEQFDRAAGIALREADNLARQIERLIEARDMLLPRLMSGELEV